MKRALEDFITTPGLCLGLSGLIIAAASPPAAAHDGGVNGRKINFISDDDSCGPPKHAEVSN